MKKAEFTSLLFPGEIRPSPARPLETVLADWIDADKNLHLTPTVRVGPSRVEPMTQLVFKRTRRTDGSSSVEFLGSTTSALEYTAMADFSFAPTAAREGQHMHGPAVSKQSTPQVYNYEGNPSVGVIEAKLAAKTEGSVAFLRFRDQNRAPAEPTAMLMPPADASAEEETLVHRVKELFNKRPVWQRASLEHALGFGPIAPWRLANALRACSYLFLDGPWRKCYVRFGFDPRADASARPLQMIDFRDPFFRTPGAAEPTSAGPGSSGADIYFRTAPTNRSQLYQLCDIEDPGIQALLAGPCRMSAADAHTGWLTEAELDSVRNQMKIKSESMRRHAGHRQA